MSKVGGCESGPAQITGTPPLLTLQLSKLIRQPRCSAPVYEFRALCYESCTDNTLRLETRIDTQSTVTVD